MPYPQRTGRGAAIAALCAVLLLFAGCAATTTDSSQEGTSQDGSDQDGSGTDSTDDGTDEGGDSGDTDSDGGEDPEQDRVRTGPVADYGGPAYGDQGGAEIVEPGVWCKTIAVFWGGDEPVPDGVTFTFEEAVADQDGLTVEGGVCGTRNADRSCLGMTVAANESGIFCSIVVKPSDGFVDGTGITFTGTLECPTAEICDAVVARTVDPGPTIIVNTPEGA